MSSLAQIPDKEKDIVVGMFYRVGMWISFCDDEDGALDDEREKQALERILVAAARAHEKSDFVRNAVKQAVSQKDNWDRWEAQSVNIIKDCKAAIASVRKHTTLYDLKVYKAMLFKIGEVVACAHGEFGVDEPDAGKLSQFMERMSEKFKRDNMDDKFTNISPAEAAHLEKLRMVLQEKKV